MTTFYVSPTGSDLNAGTSQATPLASLAQVQTMLTAGTIAQGDVVLFERGGEWFGVLTPKSTYAVAGSFLTFGAYGKGARPKLSASKVLNGAGGWAQEAVGVWRIDLTSSSTHTGYNTLSTANIGHLLVNGTLYGNRLGTGGSSNISLVADGPAAVTALASAAAWSFATDGTRLYVKATANPTTLAADIRAAPDLSVNGGIILLNNSVRVVGLELTGSGRHGLRGSGSHVRVADCQIHHLGGAWDGTNSFRLGNGIECWMVGTPTDWVVEGNDTYQCYDTAWTQQGYESLGGVGFNNIHYRHNRIWSCSQSLEIWARADAGNTGTGIVACSFTDNQCFNVGAGWGHDVRPVTNIEAHILHYTWNLGSGGLTVERNLFHGAVSTGAYLKTIDSQAVPAYTRRNNVIVLVDGTPVHRPSGTPIDIANAYGAWGTNGGTEYNSGSEFIPISASVLNTNDARRQVAADAVIAPLRHDQQRRWNARLRADIETLAGQLGA